MKKKMLLFVFLTFYRNVSTSGLRTERGVLGSVGTLITDHPFVTAATATAVVGCGVYLWSYLYGNDIEHPLEDIEDSFENIFDDIQDEYFLLQNIIKRNNIKNRDLEFKAIKIILARFKLIGFLSKKDNLLIDDEGFLFNGSKMLWSFCHHLSNQDEDFYYANLQFFRALIIENKSINQLRIEFFYACKSFLDKNNL